MVPDQFVLITSTLHFALDTIPLIQTNVLVEGSLLAVTRRVDGQQGST